MVNTLISSGRIGMIDGLSQNDELTGRFPAIGLGKKQQEKPMNLILTVVYEA